MNIVYIVQKSLKFTKNCLSTKKVIDWTDFLNLLRTPVYINIIVYYSMML